MLKATAALLKASHFPQTIAMTIFLGVSACLTGVVGSRLLLFIAAVLCGQLSVGWLNDLVDHELDRQVNRNKKPLVAKDLSPSALRIAIAIAITLCIPFSIASAGLAGGIAHLAAVASAYCYNLWLARTVWSWVPYAISFGLLPIFIAQAGSILLWPKLSMILLFVLVGVVAHLLNAVPDIDIDRKAGRGGFAVSLGRSKSLLLASVLGIAAATVAIFLFAGNAQVL